MKTKSKKIITLILNSAIALAEIIVFIIMFTKGGDGNMQVKGIMLNLRYFTNLSNLFMGLTSIAAIAVTIKNFKTDSFVYSRRLYILKYITTVMMTVTFITCVLFLGPVVGFSFVSYGKSFIQGYLFLFKGTVFFLHFLCPLISIIVLLGFEKTDSFSKRDSLYGLIPVIIYAGLYAVMVIAIGEENGGWPDFYGFTFGGNLKMAPLSAGIMLLGTYLISLIEAKSIIRKNHNFKQQ